MVPSTFRYLGRKSVTNALSQEKKIKIDLRKVTFRYFGTKSSVTDEDSVEKLLKRDSYAKIMRPMARPVPVAPLFDELLSRLVKLKAYPEDMAALSLRYIGLLEFSIDDTTLDTIFACYCASNRLRVDFGLSILGSFLKKDRLPDELAIASIASMFKETRVCYETRELFKKIVRQKPCDVDAVACRALVDGLCRDGHSIVAVEVVRILAKGRPRLDVRTLNMVVKGWNKERNMYSNLKHFYETLWNDTDECEEREVFSALKTFYDMVYEDMTHWGRIHDSLICGLCHMTPDRRIYPDPDPDSKTEGLEDEVEDVLGDMMCRYYDHGEPRKARNVYYFMDRYNIFPDTGHFDILINGCYCKTSRIDAMRLYREMRRKGLKPDVHPYAYDSILRKLFSTGRCSVALEVFDELQAVGLKPNYRTYCSVLSGLCQNGQVERAFSLLNALELKGEPLYVEYYNFVIKGCHEDGRFERAKDLISKMEQVKNLPHIVLFEEIFGFVP